MEDGFGLLERLNVLQDFGDLSFPCSDVVLDLILLIFKGLLILLHQVYLEQVLLFQVSLILKQLVRRVEVDVQIRVFIGTKH